MTTFDFVCLPILLISVTCWRVAVWRRISNDIDAAMASQRALVKLLVERRR